MGSTARRTITLAASALLPACVIFTDLDGFSRAPATTTSEDAESPRDATNGGADGDAKPTVHDAASALTCSRQHILCEDFDGADPFAGWAREVDPQGTLVLDSARSRSAPRALHATMPRRPKEDVDRLASMTRVWERPWTHVVVEMDVYLESVTWQDGDVNIALAGIELDSDGAKRGASLILNRTFAQVGSSSLGYADGAPFPTDEWTHVKMDLDAVGKTVDGAFDGVSFGALRRVISSGSARA